MLPRKKYEQSISQSACLCIMLSINSPGYDNNYYDLAQRLRQRITDMKIRIDRQLRTLAALKDRVKDQVADMQKLEVRRSMKQRQKYISLYLGVF